MNSIDDLFYIETTLDKTLLKEGMAVMIHHMWRFAICLVLIAVYYGFGGYGLYRLISYARMGVPFDYLKRLIPSTAVLLVGAVVSTVIVLSSPSRMAKKHLKRLDVIHNDQKPRTVFYHFKDSIMVAEGSSGEIIDTSYDQIIAVYETKHTIVLRRKMNLFETLDKSKVSGGSLDEFKAFLESRMNQTKFHWKNDY